VLKRGEAVGRELSNIRIVGIASQISAQDLEAFGSTEGSDVFMGDGEGRFGVRGGVGGGRDGLHCLGSGVELQIHSLALE